MAIQTKFLKKCLFSSFLEQTKILNSLGLSLRKAFHHLIQLLFSKCFELNIFVIILVLCLSYTLKSSFILKSWLFTKEHNIEVNRHSFLIKEGEMKKNNHKRAFIAQHSQEWQQNSKFKLKLILSPEGEGVLRYAYNNVTFCCHMLISLWVHPLIGKLLFSILNPFPLTNIFIGQ